MGKYNKFLVALLGPLAIAVNEAVGEAIQDNAWSSTDSTSVLIAAITALGVYLVRNEHRPRPAEKRLVRDSDGRFARDRDGDGRPDGSLR